MTYYCIAQCMFIFVCVSCRYRLIVYHITTTHVDISKMISVQQLWDIFVSSSVVADQRTLPSSNSSISAVPLPTLSPQLLSLDMQLKKIHAIQDACDSHLYGMCQPSHQISSHKCLVTTTLLLSFENFSPTFFVHMISCTYAYYLLQYIIFIFMNYHTCIKSVTNLYISYPRVDITFFLSRHFSRDIFEPTFFEPTFFEPTFFSRHFCRDIFVATLFSRQFCRENF